jgi:alcohol dehydrogenase
VPYDAFAAGLGDHRVVTTLCPGGKERMRRLMTVVESGRFNPPLITHRFAWMTSWKPTTSSPTGAMAS